MKKLTLMMGALVALGGCGDDDSTYDTDTTLPAMDMGTPVEDDLGASCGHGIDLELRSGRRHHDDGSAPETVRSE